MPKIISNTKGITLDKDGQPQVDNSFEGPAYVVQDMGLGIEEKVISLTREGDLPLRDIYWWERYDKESRIKAFDKLIGIYEAKVNGRAL